MSIRVLGQAASTMDQIQRQMDVISHNIANSNTTGYKMRRPEFSDLLFQQIHNMRDGENARNRVTYDGIRVGTGARLGGVHNDLSIGSFQNTDRKLDVVLTDKNHYFQIEVEGEEGVSYTRDGNFHLSVEGNELVLVNSDGHYVLGENGPIRFSNTVDDIQISDDGHVYVTENGAMTIAGTISLAEVIRPRVMETVGDNLFRLPDLEALDLEFDEIIQDVDEVDTMRSNKLEMSNVDLGVQMTELINAQRAYQINAKSITTADQMQNLINQLR